MIRTNTEYAQAVEKLKGFQARLETKREELAAMKLTPEQIAKLVEPEIVFYDQIVDEVASYDRLRRGDEKELERYSEFQDIGRLLIALRIFRGVSQSGLARELNVDPSQVSRDERNEYQGITLQRALKILKVLGFQLVNTPRKIEFESSSESQELEHV